MGLSDSLAGALGATDAASYLYPGEHVIKEHAVNAWVSGHSVVVEMKRGHDETLPLATIAVAAAGVFTGSPLSFFAARSLVETAEAVRDLPDVDAVGGKLTLTNFRLHFASHRLNFHLGRFSVFLPTITSVEVAGSVGPSLVVHTGSLIYRFVASDKEELKQAILAARDALGAGEAARLREAVHADIEKAGHGLHAFYRSDIGSVHEEKLLDSIDKADELDRLSEVYGVFNVVELLHPEMVPRLLLRAPVNPAP